MSEHYSNNSENSDNTVPANLDLYLEITDPEVIFELVKVSCEQERTEYAQAALRVGVIAMKQAQGQIDAETVRREGERLLAKINVSLLTHKTEVGEKMTSTLKEYFDPDSGRFHQRVNSLMKNGGELESLLHRKLISEDSELCRTLVQHVGKDSPLFKLLSPDESNGLLESIHKSVAEELAQQRDKLLKEFSLDEEQGAISRLVKQLQLSNGEMTESVQEQINRILNQFSFDDENSALSRMKSTVDNTQRTINNHLTLDDEHSALSRLRKEILGVLDDHKEKSVKFQQEVSSTLSAFNSRKQEAAASTRHGIDFEDNVCLFVERIAQQNGDIAIRTGGSSGQIKYCKVGDIVVEINEESSAAGAKIVLEAKQDSSYNIKKALEELEQARKNRGADVGVFVYSKKSAPAGLDALRRYANDIIVLWDDEDTNSDLCLSLSIDVAKALCVRKANESKDSVIDFSDIDSSLEEINKNVLKLDEIRPWAETIKNNADKILKRIRISRKSIDNKAKSIADNINTLKTVTSGLANDATS